MRIIMPMAIVILFCSCLDMAYGAYPADSVQFVCAELLARPNNNSITINLCADKILEVYVEYGKQKSAYASQTPLNSCRSDIPFNIVIDHLQPNVTYWYRVRYRIKGTGDFLARKEHSFKTAKPRGTPFTFAVEADPHLDYNTNPDLYGLTLSNVSKSNPDFLIDLGDTFMSEKLKNKTQDSILVRHLLLRSFFESICHSVPLFLAIGNHEGENGWLLDGTSGNLAVLASNTRTRYFPNPFPDAFYSGNTKPGDFVGLRGNYYAWEWGDALFVVLDPYWYTTQRQGDNWRFTLGREQYDWFKNALETSRAKFKFVFAHQILGGLDNQGRGGSDYAQYYEMGGLNPDSTWGFNNQRRGWELPVHQLMAANHVNIFFHGHDHFYARQEKDGVVYQLVPQPGYPGTHSTDQAADYGYLNGKILPSSGYLRVNVSDSTAMVDYVRSYLPEMEDNERKNGMPEYSYAVRSNGSVTSVRNDHELPFEIALFQNYPNPFNPETTINYDLPVAGFVVLKIYDVLGKEVAILVNEFKQAGSHHSFFSTGNLQLHGGIYLYRITVGHYSKCMKMICLK